VGQIKSCQKAIISIIGIARRAQWVETKKLGVIYRSGLKPGPARPVGLKCGPARPKTRPGRIHRIT